MTYTLVVRRTLCFFAALALLAGCAADRSIARKLAVIDLKCDTLVVTDLGPHHYEIVGCGSDAKYACTENNEQWSCKKE